MTGGNQHADDTDAADAAAETSEGATEQASSATPASSASAGNFRDPRVILDELLDSIGLIQRYTRWLVQAEFAAQPVLYRRRSCCVSPFWVKLRALCPSQHTGVAHREQRLAGIERACGGMRPTCGAFDNENRCDGSLLGFTTHHDTCAPDTPWF